MLALALFPLQRRFDAQLAKLPSPSTPLIGEVSGGQVQDQRSVRERRRSRPLERGPTAGTCVLHVDSWCLVYDADGHEGMSLEVYIEEVSFATKRHKLDPAALCDCA